MFCSVKFSACLEISVPGLGIEAMDFAAASKNMPNALSAWSMVFSARSRSSAGTSNFGSIMVALRFLEEVTIFPEPVAVRLADQLRRPDITRRPQAASVFRLSAARDLRCSMKSQEKRWHADKPDKLIHRKHRSPLCARHPPPRPTSIPPLPCMLIRDQQLIGIGGPRDGEQRQDRYDDQCFHDSDGRF